MKIIGVDPGYDRLGVAILRQTVGAPKLIFSDCLTTDRRAPFEKRLLSLTQRFQKILSRRRPTLLAMETVFFSRNQKTAFRVAEIRGAIIYSAARQNLPLVEYSPSEIKATVTGYGGADKKQVAAMVAKTINLPAGRRRDDEFDAMAIALTALFKKSLSTTKN